MKLDGARVLLTGAAGGIGSQLAECLVARGARLSLLSRDGEALEQLAEALAGKGSRPLTLAVDLLDGAQRTQVVQRAIGGLGGIDVLINNAGLLSFGPFEEEDPGAVERIVHLNLLVPMLLAREVLPRLRAQGGGRIVNVGSTFGTIGFPFFAAYSASKFGLRGFSEALRRELDGTGVGVTYVAPRAVRTRLNTGAVYRMAKAVKMNMDEPAGVAKEIVRAIENDAKDRYLGFPEKLFARLNALLPRLVDGGLRKQARLMAPFARDS